MARILIVTWDGGGNVPPMLGIGAELRDRGHDVRVLGHPQQRATVEEYGLAFAPYVHALPWTPERIGSGLAFLTSSLKLFTDPRPAEDVRAVLRHRPADLLLVDCMSLAALRATARSNLPTVVLVHVFHSFLTSGWARGPIGAVATLRGMRPGPLWTAADRVLVASDRELDPTGAGPLPTNVRYTGVVQDRNIRQAASPSPAVLVSMSTMDCPGQAGTLQAVFDALADLSVRAVATTGGAVDPAALTVPANVDVHRYLPHDEVMPKVSLVVGHGGHSTTMRALAHGLPLLVLPLFPKGDQPAVAAAVTNAGAGLMLPPTAPPARIREAIHTLLSNGPHRAAARSIGTRLRTQDGASAAVTEIEAVLNARPEELRTGRAHEEPSSGEDSSAPT
ncbi:glycosyltransferase [Kribbella turkmenica]|nr:glycosyltransferase [Kribbella turkmenica]